MFQSCQCSKALDQLVSRDAWKARMLGHKEAIFVVWELERGPEKACLTVQATGSGALWHS